MIEKELSKRQKEIYDFIGKYQADYGYPPLRREIAEHLELSMSTVLEHMEAMKEKGAIDWDDNIVRSIKLTTLSV